MHLNLGTDSIIIIRIILATFIGVAIGIERQRFGKIAGIRTYGTMALGTVLLTTLSIHISTDGIGEIIIAAIIIALGIISSKMIVTTQNNEPDFSNIVSLWATAAMAICIAFGLYLIAGISAILLLLIYILKDIIEPKK